MSSNEVFCTVHGKDITEYRRRVFKNHPHKISKKKIMKFIKSSQDQKNIDLDNVLPNIHFDEYHAEELKHMILNLQQEKNILLKKCIDKEIELSYYLPRYYQQIKQYEELENKYYLVKDRSDNLLSLDEKPKTTRSKSV